MPQVKGNATWLTNTRRENDAPAKNIGIDNSNARLENNAVEEHMRKELDEIHLQAHRAKADRMFELNQTRKDVKNYHRMKSLTNQKNVDALLEQRRKEVRGGNSTDKSGSSAQKPDTDNTNGSMARRPLTGPPRTGFSKIEIDDSDDDDLFYKRHSKNAATSSTSVLVPTTTAYPSRSRRRPRTSHPARSRRQIRQALQDEFTPSKGQRRPKTTLGFTRNADQDTRDSSEMPGRSFHELRDLTHIDHINSTQLRVREDHLRQQRSEHFAREQRILQNKLDQFYDRLDKFKSDSNRKVLKSTILF